MFLTNKIRTFLLFYGNFLYETLTWTFIGSHFNEIYICWVLICQSSFSFSSSFSIKTFLISYLYSLLNVDTKETIKMLSFLIFQQNPINFYGKRVIIFSILFEQILINHFWSDDSRWFELIVRIPFISYGYFRLINSIFLQIKSIRKFILSKISNIKKALLEQTMKPEVKKWWKGSILIKTIEKKNS